MKARIKFLFIFLLSIIFTTSCLHYAVYDFERSIQPQVDTKQLGEITIIPVYLNTNIDDENFSTMIKGDIIGITKDTFDEIPIKYTVNETFNYKIEFKDKKKKEIIFENIKFTNDNKNWKYLFSYIYFTTDNIEGFVYKNVWDPQYHSYYYRQVYEKKVVYNFTIHFFLYDTKIKKLLIDKKFSTSNEFVKNHPANDEYIYENYETYLKDLFKKYLPKKKIVRRYLIAR